MDWQRVIYSHMHIAFHPQTHKLDRIFYPWVHSSYGPIARPEPSWSQEPRFPSCSPKYLGYALAESWMAGRAADPQASTVVWEAYRLCVKLAHGQAAPHTLLLKLVIHLQTFFSLLHEINHLKCKSWLNPMLFCHACIFSFVPVLISYKDKHKFG